MPLKLCPSCRSRKKLQHCGIETSVRPNPALLFSLFRSQFAAWLQKVILSKIRFAEIQKVILGKIRSAGLQKVILGKIRSAGLQEVILGKIRFAGIGIWLSV